MRNCSPFSMEIGLAHIKESKCLVLLWFVLVSSNECTFFRTGENTIYWLPVYGTNNRTVR